MALTPEDGRPFVPDVTFVRDLDGQVVELPRLTARLEFRCQRVLAKHLPTLKAAPWPDVDWAVLDIRTLLDVLPVVLEHVPDLLLDLAGTVLNQPPEEVGERFSAEEIVEIVLPFLRRNLRYLSRLVASVQALVPPVSPTS